MSTVRFWYAAGACSLAIHILLKEVGIPFEAIEAAITPDGGQFPDGFAEINPKMRVPVLAIDDTVITEVPAIAAAVSGMAPSKNLMGRDALDAARVLEWMVWLSGTLHGIGFGCLWRPHRYSDDSAAHAGIVRKGKRTIRESFDHIERNIAGPFALGEYFTAVDPYLFVFYRWGNLIGIDVDRDYPKFGALGRAVAAYPSAVAVTALEKLDPFGRAAA